ncbi:MAG: serine/threonine-protein kinase PknK, partial [Myxococcales bacterium]|nr:serine/threonine-protein kinase PknK [Myxococcales bacterium]
MADPGPSANPTVLERVAPPPPAAPLARHTRIDNFRVIRLIGRGGMGEVYLAQDIKLGRRVALKLVNPEQLGSDEAKERFFFEARATARFNHENIVTIYSTGEHDGRPYVALEYVEGQTLSERLYDGDLSAREAARIGLAIARALAEAHRHNLLHRDLKPDNVLISLEGVVRVVDFGLAKVIDRDRWRRPSAPPQPAPPRAETETVDDPFTSLAAGVRGTPQYMAPEQWLGVESSGATDVWALGLILGEMVTGRRPYEDVSRDDLMSAVTSDKPVPALSTPREVPEALTALIARCLAKQADVRPSAEELVDELTAIVTQPRGSAARHDEQELSPFPGLLPFDEARAALFFGRDDEVAAFVERLRRACVLPVVGPSGVGKSSFVRAGVLPRLRERGACVLLAVRPGEHPLELLSQR